MNILKEGSKGGDVKVLQKYLGLATDGSFGPNTKKAVIQFQTSKGLYGDGIVGNKTWLKLIESDLKHNYITDADLIKVAVEYDLELAVIKAIKEVESGGKSIQNGVPTMLFEGHIFWQQLKAHKISPYNHLCGNENILYQKWTKKYYTGSNSGELNRLKKAIKINEAAAYESASYGMFQIMGLNYKVCGYSSAKEFYNALAASEDAHLYAFVNFIKSKGIIPYMKQKNWKKIAYLYNGSGYAKNQYDIRLQKAYNKYK